MIYLLDGMSRRERVTEDHLPEICVALTGGGWTVKQTAAAMDLLTRIKAQPTTHRFTDKYGNHWFLSSVLEDGEKAPGIQRKGVNHGN